MTTIGIIGAGSIGTGLATVLSKAGHAVSITNSDANSQRLHDAASAAGASASDLNRVLTADVIVLAAPFGAALALATEHSDALSGKIVIDATNPLTDDFSGLTIGHETSAAEEIAAAAPAAKVVKAFNTVLAATYSTPSLLDAGPYVPVAGDDDAAVQAVVELAKSAGFDAIAVGGLTAARFLEPTVLSLIHLAFFKGLGGAIGLQLVRS